jgi:hypothetical protein
MNETPDELTMGQGAAMVPILQGRAVRQQRYVASFTSSISDTSPELIADGGHAAVCAELAAHIRLEAQWSLVVVARTRLEQLADIVEASAALPEGDYLWTVEISPGIEATYRVTEMAAAQADLLQVA